MRTVAAAGLLGGSLLTLLSGGCPSGGSSLTAKEGVSVRAVRTSSSAIAQALGLLQTVAGDGSVRIALSGSARPTAAGADIVFGECPVVTLAGGSTAFTLDAAFPGLCAPFGSDDYLCTGAAFGVFNAVTQTIDITFDTVSCNEKSLGGTSLVEYSLAGSAVILTGEWKLNYGDGGSSLATDGAGSATYDPLAGATTINSFAGALQLDGETFNVILSQMQVSYSANANLIPSAGSAAITGDGMRDVTVYFDQNSPATGVVKVRLGDGRPFTVDLHSL